MNDKILQGCQDFCYTTVHLWGVSIKGKRKELEREEKNCEENEVGIAKSTGGIKR